LNKLLRYRSKQLQKPNKRRQSLKKKSQKNKLLQ